MLYNVRYCAWVFWTLKEVLWQKFTSQDEQNDMKDMHV